MSRFLRTRNQSSQARHPQPRSDAPASGARGRPTSSCSRRNAAIMQEAIQGGNRVIESRFAAELRCWGCNEERERRRSPLPDLIWPKSHLKLFANGGHSGRRERVLDARGKPDDPRRQDRATHSAGTWGEGSDRRGGELDCERDESPDNALRQTNSEHHAGSCPRRPQRH